jgi:class 3 adenylate cyclase
MCVGFVDLVGSTALAQRLSTRELGAVLTAFEHVAADTVTSAGGRVVKLIGDEVLYTAGDAAPACTIAVNLATIFAEHPVVLLCVPDSRAAMSFSATATSSGRLSTSRRAPSSWPDPATSWRPLRSLRPR